MNGGPNQPHALVIGSGFGGLAAAVRLGARGYKVTVLEAMDRPGGKAAVLSFDGFTFDSGPTVVTAPHFFRELWSLAGRRFEDEIDLRPVDPLYVVRFTDGSEFRYRAEHAAMCAEVARFAPEDVDGYTRFTVLSERIFQLGFAGLVDTPFLTWGSMLRILPEMVRLRSYRTVYGLVAQHVKSEKIRQVLTFHTLLVGGNPFSTTSIYCLISRVEQKWGVHFPIGGTGALVRGLVSLIESQGGQVRCGAEVERITLEGNRATGVRLRSGEELPGALVVSNADAAWTYRHLVPAEVRKRWTNARLERQKYSMSCFLWYFGTRRRYPEVAQHTILLGPRYRELLRDIFDRKVLAEDFSLYLHRATATDPGLAPPGCDAFYVLSPVPNQESGIRWQDAAEPYRLSIERLLEATVLPGLAKTVAASAIGTPQQFEELTRSFHGASFGMQPLLRQSAYFRPHNRSEDVQNLFLVGAGTHPGAGLPGVLASARVLDKLVPPACYRLPPGEPAFPGRYREDLRACRASLRLGSKSFAAAGKLLPRRVRQEAAALYAYCRAGDDAIDHGTDPARALQELGTGLDRIMRGESLDNPVDRAFCRVLHAYAIPPAIPLALFEGFAWDKEGRRYATLLDLEGYCARVAASVGVMMTLLMGPREAAVLARACDLGLAMQLTNICRDVGEDAAAGRVYLPLKWLSEAGVDPDALVASPRFSPGLAAVVERLLQVADGYYQRADLGVRLLPRDCRLAIRAARLIYAEIGRKIRRHGCDSVSRRAWTTKGRKLWLLLRSAPARFWHPRPNDAPPAEAVRFLIDAVRERDGERP